MHVSVNGRMTSPTVLSSAMDETFAADISASETQSIHAWSLADDADTDVVEYHHRSWKSPLMFLAAVLALLSAGFGVYKANDLVDSGGSRHWDTVVNPSAANPQVAPTKPQVAAPQPKPESKDDLFVRLLTEKGIPVGTPEVVASDGRGICIRIKNGRTEQQMVHDIQVGTPGISEKDAWIWADTALEVYCPQ